MARALSTDVLIVGGGVGGCAAALAAARSGCRVIMTEESDWIGGQLTSQATPPDEHGWIERFGCTASYRKFRRGVRRYYREHYPLTDAARAMPYLNPGNGWVSPLCHEPRVALHVLEEMLAPCLAAGLLKIYRRCRAETASTVPGDRFAAMALRDEDTGECRAVEARMFVDATELGDLLDLASVEHVTGSEAQADSGEPGAGAFARPANSQAFSICFAISYHPGEDHTLPRPSAYERWRSYVPSLIPPWPGPLLSWIGLSPRTMQEVRYEFDPVSETGRAFSGLWTYRRILDRSLFIPGSIPSDVTIVNWPMIDYCEGDLCTAPRADRERYLDEARALSLSVLYWLQTEAPRRDGGCGWPGLRLRPDITGTPDGLAKCPYIRESLRIRALQTVREQDVSASCRPGETLARRFEDSAGIGYYRIDLHPTAGGDNYVDVAALPFQIPLGALIPLRVENLLAGAKNIGTTHITNGCYRLHPVEWNIGEAAGMLAAFCIERSLPPQGVHARPAVLAEFQQRLASSGIELQWPDGLDLSEGDPHRHAY